MTTSWCARPISSSGKSARKQGSRRRDGPGCPRTLALTLALAVLGRPAEAQTRYAAAQFDSARFRHIAQSEIQPAVAGRERRERITVAGLLVVHAQPAAGDSIRLEAWWDSLEVRRSSRDGTLEPDTDGLIGGRYRGTLSSGGAYSAEARPFVPDGVGEVVDLSRVLEELFPTLPPRPLRVGERFRGAGGVEIRRLSDSTAGDTLLRFRASRSRTSDSVTATGDTGSIPAKQTMREDEAFAWHPRRGLVRRDRTIVVATDIPAGGAVGRPVRSRVEQRVVIERVRGKR
jgi:hypothetical protein